MANPEHEALLRRDIKAWNQWRTANSKLIPDLSGANFSGLDLIGANLHHVNFSGADLSIADLTGTSLRAVNFSGANLSEADLSGMELFDANFSGANLTAVDLSFTNLSNADLSNTILINGDLTRAVLIETNLNNANISGCNIFGISAWKLKVENLTQHNLTITDYFEPKITVDNLEIAQFVYMLVNNAKLRSVIDTLTTKSVLILGRFTEERKAVLDGIREALRQHDYVPMMFDFDKPGSRDLTGTVLTLASLSRFVLADLSDPNSIPHELMSFAEQLLSVPVQAIFTSTDPHPNPYPMYEHLRRYPQVLPIYRYDTPEGLMAALADKVIKPAEDKVVEMRPPQNPVL